MSRCPWTFPSFQAVRWIVCSLVALLLLDSLSPAEYFCSWTMSEISADIYCYYLPNLCLPPQSIADHYHLHGPIMRSGTAWFRNSPHSVESCCLFLPLSSSSCFSSSSSSSPYFDSASIQYLQALLSSTHHQYLLSCTLGDPLSKYFTAALED